MLSSQQIANRLHRFNLTNDWSVFNDVPESQQVSVLYPSVIRLLGMTDEEYKKELIQLFGELTNE